MYSASTISLIFYVIACFASGIWTIHEIYTHWNIVYPATVTRHVWNEEEYAEYRELFAYEPNEWNTLMLLLSRRQYFEDCAWQKQEEYELLDYKRFHLTTAPTRQGLWFAEYKSTNEKWTLRIHGKHGYSQRFKREYEYEGPVWFSLLVLLRIVAHGPMGMLMVIADILLPETISSSFITIGSLVCQTVESLCIGYVKLILASMQFIFISLVKKEND